MFDVLILRNKNDFSYSIFDEDNQKMIVCIGHYPRFYKKLYSLECQDFIEAKESLLKAVFETDISR